MNKEDLYEACRKTKEKAHDLVERCSDKRGDIILGTGSEGKETKYYKESVGEENLLLTNYGISISGLGNEKDK